jgi:hypothetical protein
MATPWRDLAGRALRVVRQRQRQQQPRAANADAGGGAGGGAGAVTTRTGPPAGRHLDYAPHLDGRADPGEIVWTWVPFEEDANQGKDRPVLVVGRAGTLLLGLMLSSQGYHQGDPEWFALGSGAWDGEHRPSWVRLDRVLEVGEGSIRREGAVLDRARFDQVAAALRRDHGWR